MQNININDPNILHSELEQAFRDAIHPEPGSVCGRAVDAIWLNIGANLAKRAMAEFPNKTNIKAHLFIENVIRTVALPVWYPKRFGVVGIGYWVGAEISVNGQFQIVQFTPDLVRVPGSIGNVNANSITYHSTLKILYREIFGRLWDINTHQSAAELQTEIQSVLKVYADLCRKVFGEGQSKFQHKEAYWNAPKGTPMEASGLIELYGCAYYLTKFNERWLPIPMDSEAWLPEPGPINYVDLYIEVIRNVELFALQHESFRKFEMELSANALKGDSMGSKWRLAAAAAVM